MIGGGAGLLAGLGMLAIPGVGPVVAAGWLVSTLVGAAAGAGVGAASGGVIGAMTEAGVSPDHAQIYAEGVRRGGTLVTARVDESKAAIVDGIMRKNYPVDPDQRGAAYRKSRLDHLRRKGEGLHGRRAGARARALSPQPRGLTSDGPEARAASGPAALQPSFLVVIPAKAGIQGPQGRCLPLAPGPRLSPG